MIYFIVKNGGQLLYLAEVINRSTTVTLQR